jgi:hypothetical protein
MNDAATTGAFTLGGVLAGGLIQYAIAARAEARSDQREMRRAARLVAEEVERAGNIMSACVGTGRWLPMQSAPLRALRSRKESSTERIASVEVE